MKVRIGILPLQRFHQPVVHLVPAVRQVHHRQRDSGFVQRVNIRPRRIPVPGRVEHVSVVHDVHCIRAAHCPPAATAAISPRSTSVHTLCSTSAAVSVFRHCK